MQIHPLQAASISTGNMRM